MPYKSAKIIIAGSKFDKRIKLDAEQRSQVKAEYEQGESIRGLSRKFGVDRHIIKCCIDPNYQKEFYEKNRIRLEKYRDEKRYKEKENKYMRTHRRYKAKLYKEGKISL